MSTRTRKKQDLLNVVPMARPVDPDVVTGLSNVMQMAENGEISEFAIAAVHRDGSVTTAFVADREVFALMGALLHVRDRISNKISKG